MGHCYTKEQTQTLRTTSTRKVKPQRCIYLQNPSTLILQLSNGNVENIPVKTSGESLIFNYSVGQLYFGTNNEIYYIISVSSLNDAQFLEAVHAYYLATHSRQMHPQKQSYTIQPDCAYLVKNQQTIYFIIKSKPLAQENVKFVDLVDLGRKLKQKQICWQDLQLSELITQFCRKYSKISKQGYEQISNILVGSDGSVHLLCVFSQQVQQSVLRQVQMMQKMWLTVMYGVDATKQGWVEIQKRSQFKHPTSLDYIQNLKLKIEQQKMNKYSNITNPSLKFIRDYITAYYYKLETCDPKMIDSLMTFRQWDKARQALSDYMSNISAFDAVTQETYQLYKKLLTIQNIKNKDSTEAAEAHSRVSSAAYYLAYKFKQNNQYRKSYNYYKECFQFSRSKQDQMFYYEMGEVARAINMNKDTQNILSLGLNAHPKSKILNLAFIIYLCDCMRVDEAEKHLIKATPYFRTLQMQICSAKVMLTKSILFPQNRNDFIRKSKQQLAHVVMQKYMKQSTTSVKYIIPLYHQLLGDLYLQQRMFSKAKQQYHTSKILLKNQNASGFKIATVAAAQANCLMMEAKLDQSISMYTQASQTVSQDCGALMDSIKGNRAIAKIKKGLHQQGKFDIEQILDKTSPQTLKTDFNYIFLMNVLKNTKTPPS